jgi:hypothetical protein
VNEPASTRADHVAARAVGVGIGLIVFILTWTLAARVAETVLDPPLHAYVAMGLAVVSGGATSVWAGIGLSRVSEPAGPSGHDARTGFKSTGADSTAAPRVGETGRRSAMEVEHRTAEGIIDAVG